MHLLKIRSYKACTSYYILYKHIVSNFLIVSLQVVHTSPPQTHVRFQRRCCRAVCWDGPSGWFVCYLILFGPV